MICSSLNGLLANETPLFKLSSLTLLLGWFLVAGQVKGEMPQTAQYS
jgi:hypothetical protein